MPHIPFIKMHGLGNDFIVFDGVNVSQGKLRDQIHKLTPAFARKICDRRYGIGADQILWIRPAKSKKAVARMEVMNADGSIAEMCGNGIRAVALYLSSENGRKRRSGKTSGRKTRKNAPATSEVYPIETLVGVLDVEVKGSFARVDMGKPVVGPQPEKLSGSGTQVEFWEVSMGNPHAIIFTESLDACPVETQGPLIEKHARFPKRTNVEYVQVNNRNKITVRVWERGAGITLACGTGACASAVASIVAGKVKSPVQVELPGGALTIEWSGDPRHSVFMTGPAEEVFRGEIR
jgi:diaminopimelate epimerase